MKVKHNRLSLTKIVRHDFYFGILYAWKKYLCLVCIVLLSCSSLFRLQSLSNLANPSFLDYLLYLLRGMNIYNPQKGLSFEIPVIWMMYNFLLAYIISSYPFSDMRGFGQQIMVRTQSRRNWWLGKCIWNVITVIVYYLVTYLTISLFMVFSRNAVFKPTGSICTYLLGLDIIHIDVRFIIISYFIIPIITSISLSLLQTMLSLLTKPLIGFIIIISLLTISAYYCTPLLSGNYLMIYRSNIVIGNFGVNSTMGIILATVIILASFLIGNKLFQNYNVIK